MKELIRRVKLEAYNRGPIFILSLYDTGRYDNRGQTRMAYELERIDVDGAKSKLFDNDDFAGSPLHADDSDETIRCLLGFLTLGPGDTDPYYFDGYTESQLEWAGSSEAEMIGYLAHSDDAADWADCVTDIA